MGSEREAAARNTELRQKSQTRDQQTFSIKKQKESILGFMSQVIPRAIIQFFHCSIKAAADSTGRGSACVLERLYNMWGIHWQSLLQTCMQPHTEACIQEHASAGQPCLLASWQHFKPSSHCTAAHHVPTAPHEQSVHSATSA